MLLSTASVPLVWRDVMDLIDTVNVGLHVRLYQMKEPIMLWTRLILSEGSRSVVFYCTGFCTLVL